MTQVDTEEQDAEAFQEAYLERAREILQALLRGGYQPSKDIYATAVALLSLAAIMGKCTGEPLEIWQQSLEVVWKQTKDTPLIKAIAKRFFGVGH